MNSLLQLTGKQAEIYNILLSEMRKGSYRIKLPLSFLPINTDSIITFVKYVLGDHPELLNYDNCRISGVLNVLILNPVFKMQSYHTIQNVFFQECIKIMHQINKPGKNVLQKIVAIHDYLVDNVSYDYRENTGGKYSHNAHNAYGAIVEKKAVCEGIAYAFSYLAHEVGVEASVVNGVADDEGHAWNIIRLGNNYYHIDVTGDIGISNGCSVRKYDYFCLSDFDLCSRSWDKIIYPQCNDNKLNYFYLTNSLAHNDAELAAIIGRQYPKYNAVYIKFDYLHMNENEVKNHICNVFINTARKNNINIGSYSYSLNTDQSIFTLVRA